MKRQIPRLAEWVGILISIAIIVVLVGVALPSTIEVAGSGDPDFFSGEFLTHPTATSMTVSMVSRRATTLRAKYGTDPGSLTLQTSDYAAVGGAQTGIVLQNLLPGTQYYYQVQFMPEGGAAFIDRPVRSFRMIPGSGEDAKILVFGDTHAVQLFIRSACGTNLSYAGWNELNALIGLVNSINPDLIVVGGDNAMTHCPTCSTMCTLEDINLGTGTIKNLAQAKTRYLELRHIFSEVAHAYPIMFYRGNHEGETFGDGRCGHQSNTRSLSKNARKQMIGNYYTVDQTGDPEGNYYKIPIGNAELLMLDIMTPVQTYPTSESGWYLDSPQMAWLQHQLAQNPTLEKLVFMEHLVGGEPGDDTYAGTVGEGPGDNCYYYGRGDVRSTISGTNDGTFKGIQDQLHDLFVAHGATVLKGHDHVAKVSETKDASGMPDGVTYITLGRAGGAASQWISEPFFQNEYDTDENGTADFLEPGMSASSLSGVMLIQIDASTGAKQVEYIGTNGAPIFSHAIP